jgi:hypothetical protein
MTLAKSWRPDTAEPVGMSRLFLTSGATPTSQIHVGITIGVTKPVVAARLLAIASSSEIWNPLVVTPIQEAVSIMLGATHVLALRTHMLWRLNAWAEMPTAPHSEAAVAKLNFQKLSGKENETSQNAQSEGRVTSFDRNSNRRNALRRSPFNALQSALPNDL